MQIVINLRKKKNKSTNSHYNATPNPTDKLMELCLNLKTPFLSSPCNILDPMQIVTILIRLSL